MSITFSY